MASKTLIGVIGCGTISDVYINASKTFTAVEVVACADIDAARAQAKADTFGVEARTVEDLLADPGIEIVLNLTIPQAHAAVAAAAISAGKSVYNEKPLTLHRDEGQSLLTAAQDRDVRIGCAPDTFLGGGLQTCRKLIDDGAIGQPIGATAFMMSHGPESWHPDPEFYYQLGGGPMFDMGPYYLTALIALLGPVRRVTGAAQTSFAERTITSKAKFGNRIAVEVPTHVTGILEFAAGATATVTTSFDVWAAELPRIEVYGSEGVLSAPDPNTFGGPVRLWRTENRAWQDVPLTHGYTGNCRGIGVADMALALKSGRPHRANGTMAYHVLDIMEAIHDAARTGRHIEITSTCERPASLPVGLAEGELDA
ncbi:MAG TPA: Gfo/Idh/MocA family oxidoreductase [Chloroflexota bacterium]|jgi:predicted dehydrogenase|nr:Gfo/Idh/MocA family oxidoreductase [Chloroflexota bacterium]